jgi:hypothetical protein
LIGRRYDGVRSENSALIEDMLAKRAVASSPVVLQAPANDTGQVRPGGKGRQAEPHEEAASRENTVAGTADVVAATEDAPANIAKPDVGAPAVQEFCPPPKRLKRIPLDAHPIIIFGEKLVAQNETNHSWDEKTRKQARQIFRLFGKMLWEQNVIRLEALEQRHFA